MLAFFISYLVGSAAHAADRDYTLQWLAPAGVVDGYRVHLTMEGDPSIDTRDLGFVGPDPDGISREGLSLDSERSYTIVMTAYNAAGESDASNALVVPASGCDPAVSDCGEPSGDGDPPGGDGTGEDDETSGDPGLPGGGGADPLLEYHFDMDANVGEDDTRVHDFSAYGNDGVVSGPVFTSAGHIGGAFDFDGKDDFIEVASSSPLDLRGNEITLSAWIFPRDKGASGGSRVISKRTDAGKSDVYAMYTQKSRLRFRLDGKDLISSRRFSPHEWIHVTMVYDGREKRIYLDGVLDPATQAKTDTLDSSSRPVHIGDRENEARRFNGLIDEVLIWDRALTAEEVRALASYEEAATECAPAETQSCGDIDLQGCLLGTQSCTANGTWGACEAYEDPDCASTDLGRVLEYHFDMDASAGEDDTRVHDFSVYGHDGLVNGPVFTSAGRIGGAFDFDGQNDFIEVAPSPLLDVQGNEISLSAWIFPRDKGASGGSRVISKRTDAGKSDVYAMYTQKGRLRFRLDGKDLISSRTFSTNQWIHVVMVYDGREKRIYLDGVLDPAIQAKTDTVNSSSRPVHIGDRENEARRFNGLIDEVSIWDWALAPEEVQALFTGSAAVAAKKSCPVATRRNAVRHAGTKSTRMSSPLWLGFAAGDDAKRSLSSRLPSGSPTRTTAGGWTPVP